MRIIATVVTAMLLAAAPASSDLIITEIMQNPSAVEDANGEWFEIYNSGSSPVDMYNYYIFDVDTDDFYVTEHVVVPSHGFVVFARNANIAENGGVEADYEWSDFILANGADEIYINDDEGYLMDHVVYDGGFSWPDPEGASMYYDWSGDNNVGSAWHEEDLYTYGLGDYGSPGSDPRGPSPVDQLTWSSIKALYK